MRGARVLGMALAAGAFLAAGQANAGPGGRADLYGAGVIWGHWLRLSIDDQRTWDGRSMDALVEMGATSLKADFSWIDIEPVEGAYDFDYPDRQVELAEERGLSIYAYVGSTPEWAVPAAAPDEPGIGDRFPPDPAHTPALEDYLRTVASRYCGRVSGYEFWTEPNGCSWTNAQCSNADQAQAYGSWLRIAARALRGGCPGVRVAVGGLDCRTDACVAYVQDLYDAGGGEAFDAVAIHPYGDVNEGLNWAAVDGVLQVMRAHGDSGKDLWLNEWGWDTVDETAKALAVESVLSRLELPEYDAITMAAYLGVTDLPSAAEGTHDYGLCDRDLGSLTLMPRASHSAFAAHAKVLDVEEPSGTTGGTAEETTGPGQPPPEPGTTSGTSPDETGPPPADETGVGEAARPPGFLREGGDAGVGCGCRHTASPVAAVWLLVLGAFGRRRYGS